jgi:hypothetical protein
VNRREFINGAGASLGLALVSGKVVDAEQGGPLSEMPRGFVVYIDPRLGTLGRQFREKIQVAAGTSPLLQALLEGRQVLSLDAAGAKTAGLDKLASNHIVCIAQFDDPLLQQLWQREAELKAGSLYAFGFGNFRGSLGYIESDRNPFLHAADIAKAPFECEAITITGTDAPGISIAVDAFLEQGLVNGLVARGGEWNRASATLLDRDPLAPAVTIPDVFPTKLDAQRRIAVTQAGEDEYRGVLADTGVTPLSIWRAKYYQTGAWDHSGELAALHAYSAGLHRRAYGNTVWAAKFASLGAAQSAAPLIAKQAGLVTVGMRWTGNLPQYSSGLAENGDATHPGALELWVDRDHVLIACRTPSLN